MSQDLKCKLKEKRLEYFIRLVDIGFVPGDTIVFNSQGKPIGYSGPLRNASTKKECKEYFQKAAEGIF